MATFPDFLCAPLITKLVVWQNNAPTGQSVTFCFQTVSQQCLNLERLSIVYSCDDKDLLLELGLIPTDYIVTQLHALTVIYHYCLLDSYAQVSFLDGPASL